jgi:hypothetical protein
MGVGTHSVNPDSALIATFWAAHVAGVRGYVTGTGVHGVIESQKFSAVVMRHGVSPATLGVYFLKPTVQDLRRRPAEPRLDEAVIRVATAHQQGPSSCRMANFLPSISATMATSRLIVTILIGADVDRTSECGMQQTRRPFEAFVYFIETSGSAVRGPRSRPQPPLFVSATFRQIAAEP